jgi:hypothetical protein
MLLYDEGNESLLSLKGFSSYLIKKQDSKEGKEGTPAEFKTMIS